LGAQSSIPYVLADLSYATKIDNTFIEAERDRLWKFKAPTLQKSVVKNLKLAIDINNNKLDQVLKRVNVMEEFFELRRAYPDKIKEYNDLWLNWMKRNYRKRLSNERDNNDTNVSAHSNLLQAKDFINKVDANNVKRQTYIDHDGNPVANFSNPWTRQAASDRKKRKAQRTGSNTNKAKTPSSPVISKSMDGVSDTKSKVAGARKGLKQMNQLARSFAFVTKAPKEIGAYENNSSALR
jgi:hypothetical protein